MPRHWKEIRSLRRQATGLHRTFTGAPVTWEVLEEVVDFLLTELRPGMKTMETGVGLSSLVFAQKQTDHLAVTPDSREMTRILNTCARQGLSTDKLKFCLDRSETALPQLDEKRRFDLVLIDGGHGFPTPFIDWYYASRHLNCGGHLVVDDINLATGMALYRHLCHHPHWQKVANFSWQSAVFRKISPQAGWEFEDWYHQPWLERPYCPSFLLRYFWAPLTGNTIWQKRLYRFCRDQIFTMMIMGFYHSVIGRFYHQVVRTFYFQVIHRFYFQVIHRFYFQVVRRIYFHVIRKFYLHVIKETGVQIHRLLFILTPSWFIKAYTYGRTAVWAVNLPEWPGVARMWLWKCIPMAVRRENLKRLWHRLIQRPEQS